jgi:ABC-type tungstate transport system permease subunit
MYNDFVIVGPPEDPAGIKGMKLATEALKQIAAKGAPLYQSGRPVGNPCSRDSALGKGQYEADRNLVCGL